MFPFELECQENISLSISTYTAHGVFSLAFSVDRDIALPTSKLCNTPPLSRLGSQSTFMTSFDLHIHLFNCMFTCCPGWFWDKCCCLFSSSVTNPTNYKILYIALKQWSCHIHFVRIWVASNNICIVYRHLHQVEKNPPPPFFLSVI